MVPEPLEKFPYAARKLSCRSRKVVDSPRREARISPYKRQEVFMSRNSPL